MRKVALFWIFSYPEDPLSKIEGSILDITHGGEYSQKTNYDEVLILTDNKKDRCDAEIYLSIRNRKLPFSSIENLKKYQDSGVLISTENTEEILSRTVKFLKKNSNSHFFFFYSGHSKQKNFIFPDKTYFPFLSFINLFKLHLRVKSPSGDTPQVFFLIDACFVGNFHLPFQYSKNKRMIETSEETEINFELLCLSSSSNNEKATSESNLGSRIARNAFSFFQTDSRSLTSLLNSVSTAKFNRNHGPNIYSSRKEIDFLWPWLFGSSLNLRQNGDFFVVRFYERTEE